MKLPNTPESVRRARLGAAYVQTARMLRDWFVEPEGVAEGSAREAVYRLGWALASGPREALTSEAGRREILYLVATVTALGTAWMMDWTAARLRVDVASAPDPEPATVSTSRVRGCGCPRCVLQDN